MSFFIKLNDNLTAECENSFSDEVLAAVSDC